MSKTDNIHRAGRGGGLSSMLESHADLASQRLDKQYRELRKKGLIPAGRIPKDYHERNQRIYAALGFMPRS